MIRYFKRIEIDDEKYNECIENSSNSRIYAFSWYLDCVADNWDALVLNDYETVMPLPWRQKYFIKYIYPPAWTQQLGVFSSKEIKEELILKFIKAIPKKFKKITIQFNSENILQTSESILVRKNYILELDKSNNELFDNFRKDRKARIKESITNNLIIENGNILNLIKISEDHYSFLKVTPKAYERLSKLSSLNSSIIKLVYYERELLGGVLFMKSKKRITYLFSVFTPKGKKLQAPSFIIQQILLKYQQTNLVFDFEGSMLEGVADFYKSFGSTPEKYSLYQKSILNL